jgi:hypothetical protein
MNKLKNFPVVNYPNLIESIDRKEFMESQLEKYGLKGNAYVTERYSTFQNEVQIISAVPIMPNTNQHGVTISFLNMMKEWYERADEQYGLFCDDDISFESIDNWNFTWQDVLDNLPEDWQCVQLIRVNEWNDKGMLLGNNHVIPDLRLAKAGLYDWGTSFMCKRSYVKKVLDRHILGPNAYDFSIKIRGTYDQFLPFTVEHVLLAEICDQTYNFPILLENQEFNSTIELESGPRSAHEKSYKFYSGLWKLFGQDFPIEYLMNKM